MKKIILMFLVSVVIFSSCENEYTKIKSTPIFFCGGQSNATEAWAYGVEHRLKEEYPDAIVLQQNYGGNPIENWYDEDVEDNLAKDISLISQYSTNGNILNAVFWFQGEADWTEENRVLYKERFKKMKQTYNSIYSENIKFVVSKVYIEDYINVEMDMIREELQSLSDENNDIYILDSKEYGRYDGIHLEEQEAFQFGYNMADLYISNIR